MDTAEYLSGSEMTALLAAPDRSTTKGRRDYALLLLLFETCGRAGELARLRIGDFALASRESNWVQIHGKTDKTRPLRLSSINADAIAEVIAARLPHEHVFLNAKGEPMTTVSIDSMVARYARRVSVKMPGLAAKRVSAVSIRNAQIIRIIGHSRTDSLRHYLSGK
jgi:integrase/recombinase XerD